MTERWEIEDKLREELKSILFSFEKDFTIWWDEISNPETKLNSNEQAINIYKRTGEISFKANGKSKLLEEMNSSDNKLREIESGALYTTTTHSIRQRNKLKSILIGSKSQNVHPIYENLIEKVLKMFSKKLEVILEGRDIEWEKRLINKQFEENFSSNTYDNDILKAELEKFVVTDEGRKLFQRLLSLEKTNSELIKQNNRAKSILNNLRLNYFKEINNLREMNQPWRTTQTIIDYLQVRYFFSNGRNWSKHCRNIKLKTTWNEAGIW